MLLKDWLCAPFLVKNPDGPADPIVCHPDVRRMLLTKGLSLRALGQCFAMPAILPTYILRQKTQQ